MSIAYDDYLETHKENVRKAYTWMEVYVPKLIPDDGVDYVYQIGYRHDDSKTSEEEYSAYDAYFYGGNRSRKVVDDFRLAWLHHIHKNPHHWQHWVLMNDDAEEGTIALEMPYRYVLEMLCDWWSFSLAKGKKDEIFAWYEERKERMILHPKTRKTVEESLAILKDAMQQQKEEYGDGRE